MKQKIEYRAAALTGLILFAGSAPQPCLSRQSAQGSGKEGRQVSTTQNKFYCNQKALTPEERAQHKQLGDKLTLARKAIVETEKGYEFQFSPQGVTIAELADWVMAESKCCPFFDFHIDLENEGRLVCLRLTGAAGVKQFLRSEFSLP